MSKQDRRTGRPSPQLRVEPFCSIYLVVIVHDSLRHENISRNAEYSFIPQSSDESQNRHVKPGYSPRSHDDVHPAVFQVQT